MLYPSCGLDTAFTETIFVFPSSSSSYFVFTTLCERQCLTTYLTPTLYLFALHPCLYHSQETAGVVCPGCHRLFLTLLLLRVAVIKYQSLCVETFTEQQ